MQAAACRAARTPAGRAFLAGGRGARDVDLDPCAPQPITLVADARVEVGAGAAPPAAARPAWERVYEHGMALVGTVAERLDEARAVLDAARAVAPTPRAQAMVIAQLGWVAARQGRADDALGLVAEARALLAREAPAGAPAPTPPVLDAIAADALARVWRWDEAVAPARACAERAPQNSAAWAQYARILASAGDDRGALAAAARGLDLAPRDPDLLRTQATALAALGRPEAAAALAAFGRFRAPDAAAEIRIRCAAGSARCARDREPAHTIPLRPDPGRQRSAPPPAPAHRGPASRSYERSP
jgi:tetratricopeptide (TPR) repeat protein